MYVIALFYIICGALIYMVVFVKISVASFSCKYGQANMLVSM